jgi:predicted aconitase
MHLTKQDQAMLAGEFGHARQWAMQHMLQVGRFFDAEDFVDVTQAHMMADTESLGDAGVRFVEQMAKLPEAERRVKIPMITDPRGIDFKHYKALKQTDEMANLEQRAIDAFSALGILMTDTCINYQTISAPTRGEHLAFGDTGVVIYCNSVLGAYSNFEGGPSALASGLTGRAPRYGLHLDSNRRATRRFGVDYQPTTLADWGALGAIIGKRTGSYWHVPAIEGITSAPTSDQLKHMGAAMASYGSIPLFHLVGYTPEAPSLDSVCEPSKLAIEDISQKDFEDFFGQYGATGEKVDVVVFSAPQLSIFEMQDVARIIANRRISSKTAMLVVTSPSVYADACRFGITETIERSGAMVLQGMCFYQSYAREMGLANGWRRLLTNSAKLTNIIGGYGYQPSLASMQRCID